jgi:hypothetical protein
MSGTKDDNGKTRYDLFPPEALEYIGRVLTYGATKYAARNWEDGISYGRLIAATLRHIFKWMAREQCDPETGISHLAHAACNLMFLLAYEARGIGLEGQLLDDRSKSAVYVFHQPNLPGA